MNKDKIDITPEEFEKIWREAKEQIIQENALPLPVEKMVSWIENNKSLETTSSYLGKKTLDSIANEKWEILSNFQEKQKLFNCLTEYRLVDEIHELQKGKYIRWIRIQPETSSLTNGGIVMDIKFMQTGIHILCKTNQNRILQYKFDDCITFQKISAEEYMILLCNAQIY